MWGQRADLRKRGCPDEDRTGRCVKAAEMRKPGEIFSLRGSENAKAWAFWKAYRSAGRSEVTPAGCDGPRESREAFEARFGSPTCGRESGPSLSERAYVAARGVRSNPGVPAWDRVGYELPGGDVRTEKTLKALWSPWTFRNVDFRDASYRCDWSQLDRAFKGWLLAFRKELRRRYIPLVASDASNVGVCFSFFEDGERTMALHRGGRFRNLSTAEWSVIHAIAVELARARQVPVAVHPGEPWTIWHCDADGVVPDPDHGGGVPPAVFVTDGPPGFGEDGSRSSVASDGWGWFGREPLAAPDWPAELAALERLSEDEAALPVPALPPAYDNAGRRAFERYHAVMRFRRRSEAVE